MLPRGQNRSEEGHRTRFIQLGLAVCLYVIHHNGIEDLTIVGLARLDRAVDHNSAVGLQHNEHGGEPVGVRARWVVVRGSDGGNGENKYCENRFKHSHLLLGMWSIFVICIFL